MENNQLGLEEQAQYHKLQSSPQKLSLMEHLYSKVPESVPIMEQSTKLKEEQSESKEIMQQFITPQTTQTEAWKCSSPISQFENTNLYPLGSIGDQKREPQRTQLLDQMMFNTPIAKQMHNPTHDPTPNLSTRSSLQDSHFSYNLSEGPGIIGETKPFRMPIEPFDNDGRKIYPSPNEQFGPKISSMPYPIIQPGKWEFSQQASPQEDSPSCSSDSKEGNSSFHFGQMENALNQIQASSGYSPHSQINDYSHEKFPSDQSIEFQNNMKKNSYFLHQTVPQTRPRNLSPPIYRNMETDTIWNQSAIPQKQPFTIYPQQMRPMPNTTANLQSTLCTSATFVHQNQPQKSSEGYQMYPNFSHHTSASMSPVHLNRMQNFMISEENERLSPYQIMLSQPSNQYSANIPPQVSPTFGFHKALNANQHIEKIEDYYYQGPPQLQEISPYPQNNQFMQCQPHYSHQSPNMLPAKRSSCPICHSQIRQNPDQTLPPRNLKKGSRNKQPETEEDKKRNKVLIKNILEGTDKRTTIMIRNIPSKCTQKDLLDWITEKFPNKFDFFYLPMDFKRMCNMGYGFINFIDPLFIIPFYQTFNNKAWRHSFTEKKVCNLTYARLQGKLELLEHFQEKCVMSFQNESFRPQIFESIPLPSTMELLQLKRLYQKNFH